MEIIELPIKSIIPYKNNPRHNDKAVEFVANSLRQFGWRQPIVIDEHYEIVAGHTRWKAAKMLGMETVPCVMADDLTPEQVQAYRLADNKTAEMADWDFDLLEQELNDIDPAMFDMADFGFFQGDEVSKNEQKEVTDDDFNPDEEVESRCKRGQLWKLGNHRLICGDSTDPAVIERLMDGVKADCVFTDPPYNVAIGSKNAVLNEMNHAKRGHRVETEIAGDKGLTDAEIGEQLWKPAFQNMADHAKDDCSIYVTMPQGGTHMMMMMMMMADACWQVKHELMWLKNQPTFSMGRLDYDYKHEPIMYGWKKTHNFYGKGKFTKSVWEIDKPRESKLHPTMKPIELIANALENSTKENDCVLDVFGGSGSTLIACEQLNRACYMMELDPHYCDVIIARWEKLSGGTAVKIEDV